MSDDDPISDDEVSNDASQLVVVASFNGLCRTISALAENGLLTAAQVDNIHHCMTTPLDDPEWRDDEFITNTRDVLESVLSNALRRIRECDEE